MRGESTQITMLHLTLMETTASSATQQELELLVQSTSHAMLYLPSMELTTSSTSQQEIMMVVQLSH